MEAFVSFWSLNVVKAKNLREGWVCPATRFFVVRL